MNSCIPYTTLSTTHAQVVQTNATNCIHTPTHVHMTLAIGYMYMHVHTYMYACHKQHMPQACMCMDMTYYGQLHVHVHVHACLPNYGTHSYTMCTNLILCPIQLD